VLINKNKKLLRKIYGILNYDLGKDNSSVQINHSEKQLKPGGTGATIHTIFVHYSL